VRIERWPRLELYFPNLRVSVCRGVHGKGYVVPEQNGSSSSCPNPTLRCTALGDASQQWRRSGRQVSKSRSRGRLGSQPWRSDRRLTDLQIQKGGDLALKQFRILPPPHDGRTGRYQLCTYRQPSQAVRVWRLAVQTGLSRSVVDPSPLSPSPSDRKCIVI
jgi:hypothetical protein